MKTAGRQIRVVTFSCLHAHLW